MKNSKNKILLIAGILIGLLVFTTCDNQINESSARSIQADTRKHLEEDLLAEEDDEGYEWITYFLENGRMESFRVPNVIKVDAKEESREFVLYVHNKSCNKSNY